ncbi:Dihydrofolate reductase type 3 [Methyloligella halotolerans]|uniref:Dihydrofolate reductase n=1 Tax=Methyloligella halotolerans TaxID=1177755 RepID=A0A1E2S390_9HYPH|nr:dihydrofolate reductase [Methyloligella halotolerans]ODA68986.1 Dihydrofolate reductase type 3 [Methyloligella halotolerans]
MTDHSFSSADPALSLVVAVGENGAIGFEGELPWRISSELKHFRKVTMGKPIVMGRRTYDSLGRCLDGRLNIVVTRDRSFEVLPGGAVAHSLREALELGRAEAARTGADEIAVIGGEALFKESLAVADRLYFTEVHASPEADTWFPEWDRSSWEEVSRERYEAGPKDEHPFSIVVLERRRKD